MSDYIIWACLGGLAVGIGILLDRILLKLAQKRIERKRQQNKRYCKTCKGVLGNFERNRDECQICDHWKRNKHYFVKSGADNSANTHQNAKTSQPTEMDLLLMQGLESSNTTHKPCNTTSNSSSDTSSYVAIRQTYSSDSSSCSSDSSSSSSSSLD